MANPSNGHGVVHLGENYGNCMDTQNTALNAQTVDARALGEMLNYSNTVNAGTVGKKMHIQGFMQMPSPT